MSEKKEPVEWLGQQAQRPPKLPVKPRPPKPPKEPDSRVNEGKK